MIRLLDETTVGHIAADARWSSVRFRSSRNSLRYALDAGATRVSVVVTGGGLTSIEVADDGSGIARDELA